MDFTNISLPAEVILEFQKLKIKNVNIDHCNTIKKLFKNFSFITNIIYWPEHLRNKAIAHFMQVVFDTQYIPECAFAYGLKTPQQVCSIDARLAFLILTRNNIKVHTHENLEIKLRELCCSFQNSQKTSINEDYSKTLIIPHTNIYSKNYILSKVLNNISIEETIAYAFKFFRVNISFSECIAQELKFILQHNGINSFTELNYSPICDKFKKYYSNNKMFFNAMFYQENLKFLYSDQEKQDFIKFEGYSTFEELNNFNVFETFILGCNPFSETQLNCVTLSEFTKYDFIITYKNFSCTVEEWTTHFIQNKAFLDFENKSISPEKITKLKNICYLFKKRDAIDSIKYIQLIIDNNEKLVENYDFDKLNSNLNKLFEMAMILRGKVDFTNSEYPIFSEQTVNSNLELIEIKLLDINFDDEFLQIPIFNKYSSIICTLKELLQKIEMADSIESCIRTNSNYLLYTYLQICKMRNITAKISEFDFIL